MKNSNDTIWNRTSDLPICSAALNHCATAVPVETEIDVEMQRNIHTQYCNFICKYSIDFRTNTDTIQRLG